MCDQWKEISIPVPWGHIAGKSWGDEKSSRKVLCLHGWLDNAGSFDHLIPLITVPSLHLVAIDLPGHGLSSHRPPGTNQVFVNYLVDIRRVVEGLKWDKFSFLCHSMGAGIAGLYGSVMPEHVERMVMIEGLVPFSRNEDEIPSVIHKVLTGLFDEEAKSNRVYKSEEEIVQRIMEGNTELTETSARVLAVRGTKKNKDGSFEFTRDIALKSRSILPFTRGAIAKFISDISQPTLVLMANDSSLKLMISKYISGITNPMISIQHVEGNHHVHLNQPELVAEHVSAFLDHSLYSSAIGSIKN
jgi:pimeloyl-ACP methyl ester carboxylesterase